jgi:hypothetical protein
MIFFCEDCGAKNNLGEQDFRAGRAVFRCGACGYMNAYAVSSDISETNILAKKIQSHPEIIGAFVYHKKKGPVTNHMPKMLTRADLEVLGRHLSQSYSTALSSYPDIHRVMIAISDKHITLQPFAPDLFLVVVSTHLPLPAAIEALMISVNKKDKSNDAF